MPDRGAGPLQLPGGHAAAALSIGLAAAGVLPVLLAPLVLALALLVGITRCQLGVPYPGDVSAGWLLAGAAFVGHATF